MSKNMSSTNSGYESASKKYSQLQDQYTGNAGYDNSVQQAQKGASISASNATAQQNTAMRNSGQSSNASAIMSGNNTANNYNNAFQGQQQAAYNAGTDQLNSQGTKMQAEQVEGQNKYNRSWGNLGAGAGIGGSIMGGISSIASDENLKESVKLTDTDEFFKKHKKKNYKDLLIVKGE